MPYRVSLQGAIVPVLIECTFTKQKEQINIYVISAELVHLKEPPTTSMGPEPAMDYVRRAAWGMLYADDACLQSFTVAAGARLDDGSHGRGLPSLRFNRVDEENRDRVHASTA